MRISSACPEEETKEDEWESSDYGPDYLRRILFTSLIPIPSSSSSSSSEPELPAIATVVHYGLRSLWVFTSPHCDAYSGQGRTTDWNPTIVPHESVQDQFWKQRLDGTCTQYGLYDKLWSNQGCSSSSRQCQTFLHYARKRRRQMEETEGGTKPVRLLRPVQFPKFDNTSIDLALATVVHYGLRSLWVFTVVVLGLLCMEVCLARPKISLMSLPLSVQCTPPILIPSRLLGERGILLVVSKIRRLPTINLLKSEFSNWWASSCFVFFLCWPCTC